MNNEFPVAVNTLQGQQEMQGSRFHCRESFDVSMLVCQSKQLFPMATITMVAGFLSLLLRHMAREFLGHVS